MISGLVFFDQPVDQRIDPRPIFRANVSRVVAQMLEVFVLLEHRGFVDVIVRGDAVLPRILGQLPDIVEIVPANIHIEEDHVTVDVLLPQQVLQVLAPRN